MFQALLVLIGTILLCGGIYYFFGTGSDASGNKKRQTLSWKKAIIYTLVAIIAFGGFTFYLAIKESIDIPSSLEWLIWTTFVLFAVWIGRVGSKEIG